MDKLYFDALELVVKKGEISIAILQRAFKIGFARAAVLYDDFIAKGYVIKNPELPKYKINVTLEQIEELRKNKTNN